MVGALKFFDDKAFLEELDRREPEPTWDQAAYEAAQEERKRLQRYVTDALVVGDGLRDDSLYYLFKVRMRQEDEGDLAAHILPEDSEKVHRAFYDLFEADIQLRGTDAFLDWMTDVMIENLLRFAEWREQLRMYAEQVDVLTLKSNEHELTLF